MCLIILEIQYYVLYHVAYTVNHNVHSHGSFNACYN